MAITKINSLAIPAGTVEPADISYPLTNFSSTGIDDNADATAITIDSSENVGIGTTSPGTKLHIKSLVGSGGSFGAYTLLGLDSSQLTTFEILTANNSSGSIKFNDNDGFAGQIAYSHSTDAMGLWANGSERMSINSSGQIGIGTTNPNQKLHVYENALGVNIKVENNDGAYEIQKYSDDVYLNLVDTGDVIWRLGTSLPERMRFTGTGYLGVGNNSAPNYALHIKDTANSSNMRRITIESDSNAGSNAGYRFALDSANGTVRGGGYYFVPGDTDATTYLGLSSTDSDYAMVATRENKIGIGYTAPQDKLSVNGALRVSNTYRLGVAANYYTDVTHNLYYSGGWKNINAGDGSMMRFYGGSAADSAIHLYTVSNLGQGSPANSAVSFNTAMIVNKQGEVTKPKNPAFYANHTSSTATGLIPFNSEVYDVGSNYNTTNYRFTAPVAGYYFFYASTLTLYAYNGDTRIAFYKNGGIYGGSRHIINKNNWDTSHASCLIYCAANDYIEARMFGLPTNGAVYGDAGYNQFFGFLVS